MEQRSGDFITTFTGNRFYAADPRSEDFFIEDMAHALSLQCRYGGHCSKFYSVLQHQIFTYYIAKFLGLSEECQEWALMHDTSETYLVDLPSPIKRMFPEYKRVEGVVLHAIAKRYGLVWPMPHHVHHIDLLARTHEALTLGFDITGWNMPTPTDIEEKMLSASWSMVPDRDDTKERFLELVDELNIS